MHGSHTAPNARPPALLTGSRSGWRCPGVRRAAFVVASFQGITRPAEGPLARRGDVVLPMDQLLPQTEIGLLRIAQAKTSRRGGPRVQRAAMYGAAELQFLPHVFGKMHADGPAHSGFSAALEGPGAGYFKGLVAPPLASGTILCALLGPLAASPHPKLTRSVRDDVMVRGRLDLLGNALIALLAAFALRVAPHSLRNTPNTRLQQNILFHIHCAVLAGG